MRAFGVRAFVLVLFSALVALASAASAAAQDSHVTVLDTQKVSDREGGFVGGLANAGVFGISVEAIGDLDGDGVTDLAVGTAGNTIQGTFAGDMWILLMNADGTVAHEQYVHEGSGGFDGDLTTFDHFGCGMGGLGDLDGDGLLELAVGAFGDGGRGAVWMLSLNPDATVANAARIGLGEGGFSGTLDIGDQFGFDVTALGDLDGDGSGDLAVGAPFDDDGGGSRGAVWILLLNPDGSVKAEQKISDTAGGFDGALENDSRFGSAVTALGDVDDDGVLDLAVGASADDDGGGPGLDGQLGAAWIVFLNADGTVKHEQKISALAGGFTGELDALDRFGTSLAGLGDIDGDGIEDLAVGADGDDDGGPGRGALWLLLLQTDGSVRAHHKISSISGGVLPVLHDGDALGSSATCPGDLDGDGFADLISGARLDDDGGQLRGAIWTFFLGEATWIDLGFALPGTHGEPALAGAGTLLPGDPVGLALTGALENAPSFFAVGAMRVDAPFAGGTLVPAFEPPNGTLIPLPTGATGGWLVAGAWPAGVPADAEFFFQAWVKDPGAPFGFSASNALAALTP